MSKWSFDRIKTDWLGDSIISASDVEVVKSFDLVERLFGAEWIETEKHRIGPGRGVGAVLHIIATAAILKALDGVIRRGPLILKIRNRDRSGRCEGFAAVFLRRRRPDLEIEYEPEVRSGDREVHPDFRVRARGMTDWTYIEVVAPEQSIAQGEVERSLSVASSVLDVPGTHAIEVFLRRTPSQSESQEILDVAYGLAAKYGERSADLPDELGRVFRTEGPPGRISVDDHGEPSHPGLGKADARMGPDGHRTVMTRVQFSDPRGGNFVKGKGRQLPAGDVTLVMMFVGAVVGAWRDWPDQIANRFQPTLHTRVGGVILVNSGIAPTPVGESLKFETKLVQNPHTSRAVVSWLATPANDGFQF